MRTKEYFKYFSLSIIALALLISTISIITINSIDYSTGGNFSKKQIIWVTIGILSFFFFSFFNYKKLLEHIKSLYLLFVFSLIYVLLFGQRISGAKSWIGIGSIGVQPSEFGKLVLTILAAKFFSKRIKEKLSVKELIFYYFLLLIPVVLILLQPDMGTVLTYLPFFVLPILLYKIDKRLILAGIVIAFISGIVSWKYVLKDYQKKRIKVIFHPESDPLSYGYHTIQSKIAIGSGGLVGKGYKKGTQKNLGFLPAKHTDFIISVIGEEFGFLGILTLFTLYFLLFFRIYKLSLSTDWTGTLISFAILIQLAFQFLINAAVNIGVFPVAGVTAPLLSYGGSSIITVFSMLGIVENIEIEKYKRF